MKRRLLGWVGPSACFSQPSLQRARSQLRSVSTTIRNVCETSGGAHGFGYVLLKVRAKEFGVSGANSFRILSKVQYKNNSGWHTLINHGWKVSSVFPNNSDNYYYQLGRRFDPDGTPMPLPTGFGCASRSGATRKACWPSGS